MILRRGCFIITLKIIAATHFFAFPENEILHLFSLCTFHVDFNRLTVTISDQFHGLILFSPNNTNYTQNFNGDKYDVDLRLDLSPIYFTIFYSHRYLTKCVVRIVYIIISNSVFNLNQTADHTGKAVYWHDLSTQIFPVVTTQMKKLMIKKRQFPPDYLWTTLTVSRESHDICQLIRREEGNLFLASFPEGAEPVTMIILLTKCETKKEGRIYIGSFFARKPKLNVPTFSLAYRTVVFLAARKITDSLQHWKSMVRFLDNFGFAEYNMRPKGKKCSETLFKRQVVYTISYFVRESECVRYNILEIRNCSGVMCYWNLKNFLRQENILSFQLKNAYINIREGEFFSFGAQLEGVLFSVLLKQDEDTNYGRSRTNISKIFKPFPPLIWLIIIVSFLSICATVKLTGVSIGNAWFWIYSVVLEQGNDLSANQNKHNCFLILGWMLMSIILRNLYTSSMYSYFTKVPDPTNIPESITELFNMENNGIDQISIFTESVVFDQVKYHLEKINESFHYNLNRSGQHVEIMETILQQTKWISIQGVASKNFAEYVYNISHSNPILCFNSQLEDTNVRFAILYNVIGDSGHWLELNPRFIRPLLNIFGKRKILENVHQLPSVAQPVMWLATRKHIFVKDFHRLLGRFTESGILSVLKQGYETMILRNSIVKVRDDGGFNSSWNLFTYSSLAATTRTGTFYRDALKQNEWATLDDVRLVFVLYLYKICVSCVVAGVEKCGYACFGTFCLLLEIHQLHK